MTTKALSERVKRKLTRLATLQKNVAKLAADIESELGLSGVVDPTEFWTLSMHLDQGKPIYVDDAIEVIREFQGFKKTREAAWRD